jgi:ribosomal protein S18 acetylase RimI-like enzyme
MEKYIKFRNLWDEELLKLSCGRVIIKEGIDSFDIENISRDIKVYDFVTVVNKKITVQNSIMLSKIYGLYLVDVNISYVCEFPATKKRETAFRNIVISKDSQLISQVKEISNFDDSRFINDNRLYLHGGNKVYEKWIDTALNDDRKFVIHLEDCGAVDGYILFKKDSKCLNIELIAVKHDKQNKGIGQNLIQYMFRVAEKNNCSVSVGTQLTNSIANNFYHKMGFKQNEASQIYHIWNI